MVIKVFYRISEKYSPTLVKLPIVASYLCKLLQDLPNKTHNCAILDDSLVKNTVCYLLMMNGALKQEKSYWTGLSEQ
jgi:hypothetical protein